MHDLHKQLIKDAGTFRNFQIFYIESASNPWWRLTPPMSAKCVKFGKPKYTGIICLTDRQLRGICTNFIDEILCNSYADSESVSQF